MTPGSPTRTLRGRRWNGAQEHGVLVSTRKGRADYHRATWPRRTRCKEGNLAYFYDHYGYERYDFVVQLDADHVPQKDYLRNMLRPFADPAVGYVSAPSICDRNVCRKLVRSGASLCRGKYARLAPGRLQWWSGAALHRIALCGSDGRFAGKSAASDRNWQKTIPRRC